MHTGADTLTCKDIAGEVPAGEATPKSKLDALQEAQKPFRVAQKAPLWESVEDVTFHTCKDNLSLLYSRRRGVSG